MPERLPDRSSPSFSWERGNATLLAADASFDGVAWRRTVAFFVDAMILMAIFMSLMIFNLITFFALTGLLTFLWPALLFVLYDTVLIGGRGSATIGMRLMGLKIVNTQNEEPAYLQAFVLSVLFYLSVTFTSGLILFVALFNNRGRCVHDIVTGIFVVNTVPASKAGG